MIKRERKWGGEGEKRKENLVGKKKEKNKENFKDDGLILMKVMGKVND